MVNGEPSVYCPIKLRVLRQNEKHAFFAFSLLYNSQGSSYFDATLSIGWDTNCILKIAQLTWKMHYFRMN